MVTIRDVTLVVCRPFGTHEKGRARERTRVATEAAERHARALLGGWEPPVPPDVSKVRGESYGLWRCEVWRRGRSPVSDREPDEVHVVERGYFADTEPRGLPRSAITFSGRGTGSEWYEGAGHLVEAAWARDAPATCEVEGEVMVCRRPEA